MGKQHPRRAGPKPRPTKQARRDAWLASCFRHKTPLPVSLSRAGSAERVGLSCATTKLLVDGFSTKITRVRQELRGLVYPSSMAGLHADRRIPGDRAAACRGRMEALSVSVRPNGEWMIIHQCQSCGALSANRIVGDDNALALVRLVLNPLRDSSIAHRTLLQL
ncbi:RNHCP domain-containing protein [Streptomyces sp. NPDC053750]|uniref:RNHCP domain-containing protein n=1 Tax=Streptomyces sp. NPDC053750 TaxID=3365714 RepID=UPI0037CD4FC4